MKKLVIIGAGGHGKVVADIALRNGYTDIVYLDDNSTDKECAGFPIVGKTVLIDKYSENDCIVAIGNGLVRKKIQQTITNRVNVVTLIHPNTTISRRVNIGVGTVVMAGAVINSDTTIGDGCIVNTAATIGHDNHIGNFVHVSSGVNVAGTVTIGECTWIGVGSCVKNNVGITSNCMIGAGSVVVNDISTSGTYVGVPAKLLVKDDRF